MTERSPPARNLPLRESAALAAIVAGAAALRVHGVGFGLPALNDPDEPLFMMTAIDMLRNQTLNPGWFGHPGTITIYSLALVILGVALAGISGGRFADADAFVASVYQDPAILFLPARLMIVACALVTIILTWRIGRRIGGATTGLLAAFFLAANAVHVEYSQLIRTDVQASLFMLLCTLASLRIVQDGRLRDYALAGLFAGLGCATKWPAGIVLLSPICAGLFQLKQNSAQWRGLALLAPATAAALFAASPFLLLDHSTVAANLAGEARPIHPGATGEGFLGNLAWYASGPLAGSLGHVGLGLALLGLVLIALRQPRAALAIYPGFVAALAVVCAQPLRWERWILPLLPLLSIALAFALCEMGATVRRRLARPLPWIELVAATALALLMVRTALAETAERNHDTRQLASAWVRQNVPAGSTLLVEDAAFDLLNGPWKLLFPLGTAGCVEARKLLGERVAYGRVETLRTGSPIIDLGHVDPARLSTCRADYAILTHYDRYRQDPSFRQELARYEALMKGTRLVKVIRPVAGSIGGRVVLIIERKRSLQVP